MRITLNLSPQDPDHASDLLEAFAEGLVLANMLEIRGATSEEQFPCCIKCGGFKVYPARQEIDGAEALVRRGGGNALSLIAYQVAQRRIEGDARADVVIDYKIVDGLPEFLPLIRKGDDDETIKNPVADLDVSEEPCGCGVK